MMNTDERKELTPPLLSILQRLDRLELMVLFLEGKQCYTAGDSAVAVVDKYLKQEEYALEEVHHKGTLLERVALLENRVNQLSIDMDLGNTSRSSSSTSGVAGKLGKESRLLDANEEKQDPLIAQDSIVVEACSLNSPSCRAHRRQIKAMSRFGYNRRWLKWLKLGC